MFKHKNHLGVVGRASWFLLKTPGLVTTVVAGPTSVNNIRFGSPLTRRDIWSCSHKHQLDVARLPSTHVQYWSINIHFHEVLDLFNERLLWAHIQSSLFFFLSPCNHLRQRPHHGCRWRYLFYNYKPAKTSFYRNRTSGYSEISGMLLRFQTLFVQAAYARSF